MRKSLIVYIYLLCIFSIYISCTKQVPKNDKLENLKITLIKDKESKEGFLVFGEDLKDWTLFYNDSLILNGSNKKNDTVSIYNRPLKHEVYVFLANNHQIKIAEEHLPMSGGFNFRDLGGLETKDGRVVKWGRIIRSDDLYNLTDSDLSYLNSLPLKTIVDFRAENEIQIAPDRLPESLAIYDSLSINPGNVLDFINNGNIDSIKAFQIMKDLNIALVSDSNSVLQYQKFFKLIQNSNDAPLLFHCSAGKDRTGMGAALVLFALGISEDLIFDNYLKSNVFLADKYKSLKEKNTAMSPFFEVHKEYLKAGIDEINKKYGSVDNYIVNTLNVDTMLIRKYFLYND